MCCDSRHTDASDQINSFYHPVNPRMGIDRDETKATLVGDKAQTTIPQSLREKYGIEPGETIIWEDTAEGLVVRKVIEDAGRGLGVDDSVSDSDREAMAEALETEIRNGLGPDWAGE